MDQMVFTEFTKLVESAPQGGAGVIIPVYRRALADMLTPVSAFVRLKRNSNYSFLLESVEGGERFARYSFLGRNPLEILSVTDGKESLRTNGNGIESDGNGIESLRAKLAAYDPIDVPGLPPFTG